MVYRKYFFGFSKSAPTPRYTNQKVQLQLNVLLLIKKVQLQLDESKSPAVAISEGRLPLCNTSSEAGALPSEVRIENDSDRKFSKSIFFKVFLETTFLPVLWYPVHY